MIKLEIPAKSCKECPYLKTRIIDHNYYGETSTRTVCSIFGEPVKEFIPCEKCIMSQEETHQDVRKYADFLVKEINKMAAETRNRTLDELLAKASEIVIYEKSYTPILSFKALMNIVESMKEK